MAILNNLPRNFQRKALQNSLKKAKRVSTLMEKGTGVKVSKGARKNYVRDRLAAARSRSGKQVHMYF